MSVFWSLAIAMALLALAFVLPPLLRERKTPLVATEDINTAVNRERLAELELDMQSGRLEQAQYEAARQDLERELLNDLEASGSNANSQVRSGRWAALLLAAAVPVSATLLYKAIGSEQVITLLEENPAARQTPQQAPSQLSVEEMVSRLAARMESEPDNLKGWMMLAKSYSILNRYAQAVPAYRNIMRLGGGNNATVLADFADALVASGNGAFTDEAGKLLTDALELEPDNIKALWLAGHWRNQSGDAAAAVSHWERAAGLMQAGSEDRLVIERQIQLARQQAGLPKTTAQPAAAASTTVASKSAAGGSELQVTVSLDPALAGKANADDTVFIYARAAKGPRMPLAIVRKQVSELPVTVTLDDAMAMAPGMVLSGYQEVTVGARISKSGNAMAQSGDLQGTKSPVRPADTNAVAIVINSTVP